MHWALEYIGKRFDPSGEGPDAFNCLTLLEDVYQRHYGIAVSDDIVRVTKVPVLREYQQDWTPSPVPFDGAGVGLSQREAIHHVGIYLDLDGGKVLHCWSATGVILSSLRELRSRFQFKKVLFYRHRLWPT